MTTCLFILLKKKGKIVKTKVDFSGSSYTNLDEERLITMLIDFDWNDFAANNINDCWNIMYTRIKYVIDILCPVKHFKFSREKPNWLSNDIILLLKERDFVLENMQKPVWKWIN